MLSQYERYINCLKVGRTLISAAFTRSLFEVAVSFSHFDDYFRKEEEKRPGDKRQEESKEGKKTKTPASGKSRHETKKFNKDLSFDQSKMGTEKGKKNEKQGATDKKNTKNEKSPKDEQKSGKSKTKTSSESKLKTTNSDSKTKSQSKPSKSKEKNKSEEKISGEDMKHEDSDKGGSKGSSKKTSKQKLESELSEKDGVSKGASEHSKDRTSQGKKSDKSNKSESGKSRKISDSSRKRKEKDKDVEDQDMKDKLGQMKPQSEDSQEGKTVSGKARKPSEKGDKKTKPGTTSEKTSGPLAKEKSLKTDAEEKPQKTSVGKSVKFPNVFQHIIHYVLSNPLFVKLGWTLAPSDRSQLQVVTFRTLPATPHTYCFRERTEDEIKYYSKTLERVAFHFRVDGTGEIFYPSGVPAAIITNHSTGMRLTLYSDPKNDPLISDSFKSKILAIFDSFGNGVVYDLRGKKLLNFNQLEGTFSSPNRQSPYKWQWCDYKILDQQRLKALLRYLAKEQKQPAPTKKPAPSNISTPKKAKPEEKKSEVDEAYEQILAELPYPFPQKTKTKSENQVWGFKPITLKINSEMALRINGQDDITVSFSSNQIFLRIDLGVKIDPDVVERIEALAPKRVSDVPCVFDGLLDPSQSLLQLTGGYKKSSSKNKLSVA